MAALRVKERTFQNSETAFLEGETALRNSQKELRALEADEARALVVLGDVEAQAQDSTVAREQLDSLRARQELARREQERLAKDQAARRRMLELAQADLGEAQHDYQCARSVYQQAALREHEERELPKVQRVLREYLTMRRALAGSYRPRDSQWWFCHLLDGTDFRAMVDQVNAVRATMEDFIRGE